MGINQVVDYSNVAPVGSDTSGALLERVLGQGPGRGWTDNDGKQINPFMKHGEVKEGMEYLGQQYGTNGPHMNDLGLPQQDLLQHHHHVLRGEEEALGEPNGPPPVSPYGPSLTQPPWVRWGKNIDPQDWPQSRPVGITIFTQVVLLSVRPNFLK